MSTANKLTYLNVTKQKLKQAINNIGGEVTDETTFRQYANQLQNVYDNLPKTEFQEGTEVTIENGLKGKLDFEDGIVGIGQTSQKSYSGKNLYPSGSTTQTIGGITFTPQADGGIKLNGTSTYANYYVAGGDGNYVEVANLSNKAENMALSVSGMQNGIQVYVVGTNLGVQGITNTDGIATFTTIANDTYRIFIRVMAEYSVDTTLYIQLEKGSSATSFEPYVGGTASPNPSYPQEVKVVRGKNEANPNNLYLGQTLNTNGTLTPLDNRTTLFENPIKPNTQYTLSINNNYQIGNLFYYNKDKTYLSQVGSEWGNNKTAITPANAYYISFATKKTDNTTMTESDIENLQIQIEKGSQATSYLPYNTIEVVESGKNLFGFEESAIDVTSTYREQSTQRLITTKINANEIKFNFNGGNYSRAYFEIGGIDGTQSYSISFNIKDNTTSYTPTITKDTTNSTSSKLIILVSGNNGSSSVSNTNYFTLSDIMVSVTNGAYEPYHTPRTYQFSLGNNKFYNIGDYADELLYDVDEDRVYKNEKIGELVLNGSENYTESSFQPTSNLKFYLLQSIPDAKYLDGPSYVVGSTLNNYLKDFNQNEYTSGTKEGFLVAQNGMNFCISNMTLQEFKAKLQQHNMKICYITNATKEIPITDTTLHQQVKNWYYSQSYNGTTILESNGDLPMIIKVRALKGE